MNSPLPTIPIDDIEHDVIQTTVEEPQEEVSEPEVEQYVEPGRLTTISIELPVMSGGNTISGYLPERIDTNLIMVRNRRVAAKAIMRAFQNSSVVLKEGNRERNARYASDVINLLLDAVFEALPDKS